ncbi:hypothetical protein ONZ43_g4247 [Nemania bipapillata]|uniref:Uncharacterized protein n=1 Tax=Nemania bipapillata TaxID=110536 RepID=A0ACC2IQ49_9PEZI|nr:hypothetical protein ONZ43_g4247 [Nemania bipapillata]
MAHEILSVQYSKAMKSCGRGHGLYHPPPQRALNYGVCGYIDDLVLESGLEHEQDLRAWAKKNKKAILQRRPEVKRYGFWVVQTIWTTEDAYTNTWTQNKRNVSVNLGAMASGLIGAEVAIQYGEETTVDGGWVHPLPTGDTAEKYVIFFNGPRFKYLTGLEALPFIREVRGGEEEEYESDDNTAIPININGSTEEFHLVQYHSDSEDEEEEEEEENMM